MSTPTSSRELLSRVRFFSELDAPEFDAIVRIAGRRSIAPGETVIRQGDQDGHLYAVGHGLLQVSRELGNAKEIALSLLRTGDLFGEVTLFDQKTRSATVMALQRCELFAFPREQVLATLRRHPELGLKLLEYMAQIIRRLTLRAEHAELSVPMRVAKKLLELADICGTKLGANSAVLPPTLNQQDLANHVQATRESVNRCIMQFVKQGLLHQGRHQLTILDLEGLKRLANQS